MDNPKMNFEWKDGVFKRKTLWTQFGDALIERDGLICFYCGRDVVRIISKKPYRATIDHIIAKANGGRTALDNLVIACQSCNQEKGSDVDFLTMFHRKAKERAYNREKRKA